MVIAQSLQARSYQNPFCLSSSFGILILFFAAPKIFFQALSIFLPSFAANFACASALSL